MLFYYSSASPKQKFFKIKQKIFFRNIIPFSTIPSIHKMSLPTNSNAKIPQSAVQQNRKMPACETYIHICDQIGLSHSVPSVLLHSNKTVHACRYGSFPLFLFKQWIFGRNHCERSASLSLFPPPKNSVAAYFVPPYPAPRSSRVHIHTYFKLDLPVPLSVCKCPHQRTVTIQDIHLHMDARDTESSLFRQIVRFVVFAFTIMARLWLTEVRLLSFFLLFSRFSFLLNI